MKTIYRATGKRKASVAQVMLFEKTAKKPKIKISTTDWKNGVELIKYFPNQILVDKILKPLFLTKVDDKFDVKIKIRGGGFNGQSEATRHAISKVLIKVSGDYLSILKQFKLLTRDSRKKERKKYGLKKARKAPQFSKR